MYTEASYQNESYDSVSRKPLDGFEKALNTKKTFLSNTVNNVYSGKNGQAPEVRYSGRFR